MKIISSSPVLLKPSRPMTLQGIPFKLHMLIQQCLGRAWDSASLTSPQALLLGGPHFSIRPLCAIMACAGLEFRARAKAAGNGNRGNKGLGQILLSCEIPFKG